MVTSQHDTVLLKVIYPRLDAEEYRDRLIGSVVKYPDMPTERYIPSKSTEPAIQIIPTIDPKPFQIRNIGFLTQRIEDVDISSMVNDILEGFSGSSNTNAATLARVWHMDSPDKNFEKLLKNKAYFKQLFNMLRSSQDEEGYFITDILTLVDITEQYLGLDDRYSAVLASSSPSLRTQIEPFGKQYVVRENKCSGYAEGELVIFLGYRRVRLEKVHSFMAMVRRIFQGQGCGYTARLDSNYQPRVVQTPTKDIDARSDGKSTWKAEGKAQLVAGSNEHTEIVRELGFDVKIVG
jgi:hypothetical protein